MRFGKLDIPNEILEAQENGSLVIFAGAGVSFDSPAKLPDFKDLAFQIGQGTKLPFDPESNEPIDQYLGKLVRDKVNVHDQAKRILTQNNPQPNHYHSLIQRLFSDVEHLKIVTTNQDQLLLKDKPKLLNDIPVFEAPALPVGDDFSGLVFLHGSVRQESRRMVLTDVDFSKAYLTEGWARRFLLKLFEKYTVLFVGYSHDDMVIRYLARGLPADGKNKRFAFTPKKNDDDKHWEHLGIEPIWYEIVEDSDEPHSNLRVGISEWVAYSEKTAIQHNGRIIDLARAHPPIDEQDGDYLKHGFRNVAAVSAFVDHANKSEWLSWIAERGFLDPLFIVGWIEDDKEREKAQYWAHWLARLGVIEGLVEVFTLIRKKGNAWNSILWFAVAQKLHSNKDIPHDRFNHWVRALLAAPLPSNGTSSWLGYALDKCKAAERQTTALLLFECLTRPIPKLKERLALYGDDEIEGMERIRWDVSFPEDDYWVNNAWEKVFFPDLDRFAEKVLPIAEANLALAYNVTQLSSNDFNFFDHSRYNISSSDDEDHIRFNGVVDVLIDTIRDCLRWLVNNKSDEGLTIARRYMRSGKTLFIRIALDSLTHAREAASPDETLSWILDADLIRTGDESVELSQLLEKIYPLAEEKTRIAILDRLDARYTITGDDDDRKWISNTRLSTLEHLSKAAPGCSETTRRFNEAKEGIPEDQLPSGVPGERHAPKAERVRPISPYSNEEILSIDPVSVLSKYDELDQEDFWNRGPDKNGLESQVRESASKNLGFGLGLTGALQSRSKPDHPLWRAIFQGWARLSITGNEWEPIIKCLENNGDVLSEHHSQAAELLKAIVQNEERRPPFDLLPRLEKMASNLWNAINALDDQRIQSDADSLTHAINATCGVLTQLWLHSLSWRHKEAGPDWKGLPEEYQNHFNRIVADDTYGASMGQVILARQLHFVAYLDEAWTSDNLLPLFSVETNEERAIDIWTGFALQGRMSPTVVNMLRDHLRLLFDDKILAKLTDEARRGLVQRIAAIVHHEGARWWSEGMINAFFSAASDNDRSEFARTLGSFWEASEESWRKEAWDAWIAGYIQNRMDGKPVSLSASETNALATWIFPFAFMADHFIDVIIALPEPDVEHTHIFYRLAESDIPNTYPEATLRLISWLLRGAIPSRFWEEHSVVKIVQSLQEVVVSNAELQASIGEQCVKLGMNQVLALIAPSISSGSD